MKFCGGSTGHVAKGVSKKTEFNYSEEQLRLVWSFLLVVFKCQSSLGREVA